MNALALALLTEIIWAPCHVVVKCQETDAEYTPLNSLARVLSMSAPLEELTLSDTQAQLTVRNSI